MDNKKWGQSSELDICEWKLQNVCIGVDVKVDLKIPGGYGNDDETLLASLLWDILYM